MDGPKRGLQQVDIKEGSIGQGHWKSNIYVSELDFIFYFMFEHFFQLPLKAEIVKYKTDPKGTPESRRSLDRACKLAA